MHANNLNPRSYHYLKENVHLNKCDAGRLLPYNMDGQAFIHCMIFGTSPTQSVPDHFLMNLPATAVKFLDAFWGYESNDDKRPTVHVHCFAPKEMGEDGTTPATLMRRRCKAALGCLLDNDKPARTCTVSPFGCHTPWRP